MESIKYEKYLYTTNCVFQIEIPIEFGPNIVSNSLHEAIDMYKKLSIPIKLNKDGNYILINIYNPSKYLEIIPSIECSTKLEFKRYLERNSYLRELRISPDGIEIYTEVYHIAFDNSHIPEYDGGNFYVDYTLMYESPELRRKIKPGDKFISSYYKDILLDEKSGETLTDKIFNVESVPTPMENRINSNFDMQYGICSGYFPNGFDSDNISECILYGDFNDAPIPVSTMKFL